MPTLTGTNCTISRLNIGMDDCQVIEGLLNGFYRVKKGYAIDLSTVTINKAWIDDQIQLGLIEPFVGVFDAIAETPDATTEESQSGIMSVVRQGKPTITATFKKGKAFQKAAFSSNSQDGYDYFLIYESNVMEGVLTGNTLKGFDGGMFNTNGYNMNNGTNSASSVVKFQLTNPYEFNVQCTFIADLDFNLSTGVNGIIDTVLTGRADVSDNKIYVKPTWLHNAQEVVEGMALANFRATLNGTVNVLTGTAVFNSVTGEYALTPTTAVALGQSWVVQLYSSTLSTEVAKVGTKFYKGATTAITPVA
jgi:hypothetical protein